MATLGYVLFNTEDTDQEVMKEHLLIADHIVNFQISDNMP